MILFWNLKHTLEKETTKRNISINKENFVGKKEHLKQPRRLIL